MLAMFLKKDPGVSAAISTVFTADESSFVAHGQELAPRPEREVVAVSLLGLFKIFRRLPKLVFTELLFVGYAFAGA
jgi:hypothetical protein